jgi:ectoine hydroxylase-related dioxygenase (phytanoyl-CoA dioxygenase family)
VIPAWHIDGDWFTHHLGSAEQVLTPIFLWDDVGEDDGPTLLAAGSHRRVAQLLAEHEPSGIPGDRILAAVDEVVDGREAVAATGRAGDVYLCHPHLVHSINPMGAPRRRVISNVCVHHWGPLRFRDGDLNAVERAIAQTLTPTSEPMT